MTELIITGLRKTYGERTALNDVNITVRQGEIFGFVGSNGAGKTTTMRAVLGVIEVDSGEILIDGRPISPEDRRRIGYMPEERGLYPKMRVGDQLTYLARLHGLNTAQAAESMRQWTERLGIGERQADLVDNLSLGNQQRVQLAAALTHAPSLLVLDEPFSGLDPVAVSVMAEVLRETADRGIPVIFSSHQLELVERLCDRVGIIADGSMVAQGTVEELRAGAPVRYRIVASGLRAGWAAALPWVKEEATDESGSTVELSQPAEDPGIRAQRPGEASAGVAAHDGSTSASGHIPEHLESALLRHALRSAEVTEFTRIRPNLTQLYQEVVSA